VAVSKDGLQYRFVIPGTRLQAKGIEVHWRRNMKSMKEDVE